MLADCGDPGAPDPEAHDRLGGNCIVSAMTVKSVIFEPEASRVWISTGVAPTGLGPYVDVDYSWDGPVGRVELPASPALDEGRWATPQAAAMRGYVAVTRAHLEGASPIEVRAMLERVVAATPSGPNYRFLAAIFAISAGDFAGAARHLGRALEREQGSYRRALCLLWQARALSACGRESEAARARKQLIRVPAVEGVAALQKAGAREAVGALSRLRTVVPDVFLIDAALPGVGV
ncbi:hypothetical protein G6O69_15865 [Pseudenhygromyxa sp. WMMC2535]|uniref:tetratricopeptide repeat protein n=1 Tax=Pseudenhygromyxa sp. WMMC2535 TaxID=2712867 RepID=UPI0015551F49|nr:hypothetical protein [Pseudenhygromyxa sp. WMMC2535]NVB39320.1 hypothetical protein [Pseudenhygromyxa sp. WMMC2535]